MSIHLTKDEYNFLRLGLGSSNSHGGKMSMYMTDGKGMIYTSNGYSIHAIFHNSTYERGYYLWNQPAEQLLMIKDTGLDGKDLIKASLDVRQRYIDQLTFHMEQLDIISFINGKPNNGLHLDQPAGKTTTVGFRKGMYKEKECAICVGSNFAPVRWGDENKVELVDIDEYIVFDLKLLIGIMKHISTGKMIWRDSKSPCIFGNIEAWHAIVMPMRLGGVK